MELKPFMWGILIVCCGLISMYLFGCGATRFNARESYIQQEVKNQIQEAGGMVTRKEFDRAFKDLATSLRDDLKRQSEKQALEFKGEIDQRCSRCQ